MYSTPDIKSWFLFVFLEGDKEDTFEVELYQRGCALLVNTTEAKTYTVAAEIKTNMDLIMPDDATATFTEYKGKLVICDDADDCNKAKLDEVSGSTAIGASACLLATMLTLLVVGIQA